MPKLRTTLVLLLACLACGMLLWVLERPAMRFSRPAVGQTGKLFPVPLRDVDYLMIECNGFRAELHRKADGWVLTQPVAAYANQTAVQRMLDRCERAPLNARIDAHALRLRGLTLADFGLVEPQARLIVSGPRTRAELLLGHPTSTSNELFCSFMQTEAVLLTDLSLLDAFPRTLFALSDSSFFRGDLRRVAAIGLRRPGLPFLKMVRDAGGWTISQPITARADSAAVAWLLDALSTTKIARFVWPEGDRSAGAGAGVGTRLMRFGLDDAAAGVQIQVWMAGDPVAHRFLLGRAVDALPGHVHALADDGVAVVAVSNALLEAAMQPIEALRDKRLFAQTAESFRSLAVQGVAAPFSLRRDANGAWELTSPVSEVAEATAVAGLLDALLRLRAVDFAVSTASDDGKGGGIRVDLAAGTHAFRLLAAEDLAGQMPTVRIAFTNDATVYLVPTSQWAQVVGRLDNFVAFRNRTLFALPADGIRRLSVQRADGTVETVEHELSAKGWRSTAPDRSVNRVALDAWLAMLAHLRAERVETLNAEEGTAAYGLDRPYMEIAVDLTAEDSLRRILTIGARTSDDGRFAIVKGHDTVFVLNAAAWHPLDQPLLNPVEQPVPAVGAALPPFLETL